MVTETKAKVVYRELLKEDLVVIRLVPETGMPEYETGQFWLLWSLANAQNGQ